MAERLSGLLAKMGLVIVLLVLAFPMVGSIKSLGASSAEWTVFVYMAGDNDLEPAALKDLAEMEAFASTSSVNVVVLLDRSREPYEEQYNTEFARALEEWSGGRVYYVVRDGYTLSFSSKLLEELGDVNTGDPVVLVDFVNKYSKLYPAKKYALIIWDHGATGGGVAFDVGSRDYLTPKELREAVKSLNIKLNLLAFDACLMSAYEVLYELRGLVDYVVASEETVPNDGYPYDMVLEVLTAEPTMEPSEFGKLLVEKYREFYINTEDGGVSTLSLIDMESFNETVGLVKEFAHIASNYIDVLRTARERVNKFGGGPSPDNGAALVDFTELLKIIASNSDGDLSSKAEALASKLEESIKASWIGKQHRGARGISIYFPLRYNREAYTTMSSFGEDTGWVKVLEKAVNIEASMEGVGNSEQVYQGSGQELASEAMGQEVSSNVVVSVAGLGPIDMDGDGGQELVSTLSVIDDYKEIYGIVLSVFKYNPREKAFVNVYSDAVDVKPYYVELGYIGALGVDVNSDGREEVYVAHSVLDYSTGEQSTYVTVYRYSNGGVDKQVLPIQGFAGLEFVGGDIDWDGEYEIVLSGYMVSEDPWIPPIGGIVVYDASKLTKELAIGLSENRSIGGIAVGNLTGEREYLIIGVNKYDTNEWGNITGLDSTLYATRIKSGNVEVVDRAEYSNLSILSISCGDIDSDGSSEILVIVGNPMSGTMALDVLEYNTRLSRIGLLPLKIEGNETPATVFAYDIDGDGIVEVMIFYYEVDIGIAWLKKIDLYSWMPSESKLVYESTLPMEYGERILPMPIDVNGDGVLEIAYVREEGDRITVLLGGVENYVDPTGTIKGRIVDSEGKGVEGAHVVVAQSKSVTIIAETASNTNGEFNLTVPAGTYSLIIEYEDTRISKPVVVESGKETIVTISLGAGQEEANTQTESTTQLTQSSAATATPTQSQATITNTVTITQTTSPEAQLTHTTASTSPEIYNTTTTTVIITVTKTSTSKPTNTLSIKPTISSDTTTITHATNITTSTAINESMETSTYTIKTHSSTSATSSTSVNTPSLTPLQDLPYLAMIGILVIIAALIALKKR